jgi:SAM-dependent methyltransferase
MKKLNFACGQDMKEGYVNVDWDPLIKPDVSHNLNTFPYPFKDEEFDLIDAFHAMEHLDRPFEVMKEFNRILKPGGTLHIKVPHFSRGFTHSEHAHGFDVTFPLYFRKDFLGSGYTGVDFKLEKLEMHWSAFRYLLPNFGYGAFTIGVVKVLNTVFSFLANLSPNFCSRLWCFWVGGFEEIEFYFTKPEALSKK